jgi:anti-anti-sigma factor
MSHNVLVDRKPDGTALVLLMSRLDAETALDVEVVLDELMKHRPWRVVFNLERLSYISSAGVRIVLKVKQQQAARNGQFFTLNFQPQVKRVFDLMQVLRVNEMFDSEADLDAYLDSVQQN